MTYTEENRGRFQYEERAKQMIEFVGIQYRDCTPTDVDLFIEKNNKAFIFSEIKHKDADLPYGQSKALTRVVDALDDVGKDVILFIGRHEIDDPNENVIASDTEVSEIYFKNKWWYAPRDFQSGQTLKEMIDAFLMWSILGIVDERKFVWA